MRFANDFHSWLRHSWKSLANRLTRDPKIVIHGNSCIILYIFHAMTKNIEGLVIEPVVDNVPIERVTHFNFLGLNLNDHMSWKPHIDAIAN